jgi:hypothetical protein
MKTLLQLLKVIALVFLFGMSCGVVLAQNKQGNIWYFGSHAGVDFNSGSPIALTNSAMFTTEGCATICDTSGNLLFYTDGVTVYNRFHNIMSNGTGLLGDPSTSQSSLIVAAPGFTNIFYIFTMEAFASGKFCYSIVDMNLNGGNGAVLNKNIPIYGSGLSEKLAGTRHANGIDVWITVHVNNSNQYRSYLITSAGLGSAVVTNVGTFHNSYVGYMKFSPNGNKLAAALYVTSQLDILDFDNTTGIFSNPITFTGPPPYYGAYGVEFSGTGSTLYLSNGNSNAGVIYQFNLNAGLGAAIIASAKSVYSKGTTLSALQIGSDGKIYFCEPGTEWLGVINNPDSLGLACNAIDSVVNLGTGTCLFGLPNFVSNIYSSVISTGINQLTIDNGQMTIAPNPNNGIFRIKLPKIITMDFSIRIINPIGQEIYNKRLSNLQSTVDLQIENDVKGLYLLELVKGDKVYRSKFMVQ